MVDILKWILYAGGAVMIVSWVAERWPWFQALASDVKKILSITVSCALALGGYALLLYVPPEFWVQIDPWIKLVLGVASSYGIGQVVHYYDSERIRLADERLRIAALKK